MTEGTACRLSLLPGFSESIPLGEYRRYITILNPVQGWRYELFVFDQVKRLFSDPNAFLTDMCRIASHPILVLSFYLCPISCIMV